MNSQNKVLIHTPDELLSIADNFINTKNPEMYRAAVLEAITALEYFVQIKVFGILEKKMDKLLVDWLKERTNSDFETRLKIFTPVATNITINTREDLWQRYQEAKKIRNKVAHTGIRISLDEAQMVRDTVYDWLAFLGSTTEVEMELIRFKKYIEKSNKFIDDEIEIEYLVSNYFKMNNAQVHSQVHLSNTKIADIVLRYGDKTILIETMIMRNLSDLSEKIKTKKALTQKMLLVSGISRGAILIFHNFELPDNINSINTSDDGKLSIIYIRIINSNFSFKKR